MRSDLKNQNPQDLFRNYRFWVACEADEELPHLLNYIGEDHIVIGSDYGHNDPSKESEFGEKYAGAGRYSARGGGEDSLPQCARVVRAFLAGNCRRTGEAVKK